MLSTAKIFTAITVLLPILSVYLSPIEGVDLGTFIVLLFGLLCLKKRSLKFSLHAGLTIVMAYTLFYSLLITIMPDTTLYSSTSSIISRLFRFILMLIIMIGVGTTNYVDREKLIKFLRIVSLIVAVYAILQLIFFHFTGLKLINTFGPTKQGVIFHAELHEFERVYRPPSLFLEPSSAVYYLVPYLCYALFYKEMDMKLLRRNLYDALIISLGILCTTSGQGFLVIVLCWSIWLLRQIYQKHFKKALIPLFVIILMQLLGIFPDIDYTISRISAPDDGISAIDARAGGYDAFEGLDSIHQIFGTGFGNYDETIYYSSFADILFCTGICGLILVLAFLFSLFIKGQFYQKILVITMIVLMSGGGIYSATYLCFYLPILFLKPSPQSCHGNAIFKTPI